MQVGEYGSVLFGRLRRLTALPRLRAAQQLSNDSTQVSFQISKKICLLISGIVTFSDPESGLTMYSLLSLTQSDHRGARDPVDVFGTFLDYV